MATEIQSTEIDMAKAMGGALKILRKRAGLTQAEAAEKSGHAEITYGRYERSSRDITLAQGLEIVKSWGLTEGDLMGALDVARQFLGSPFPMPAARSFAAPQNTPVLLPVRDRLQAGVWLEADDTAQVGPVSHIAVKDPRYPNAHQWLGEVVGDSMTQLGIWPGDLVHLVDTVEIGYHPRTNDVIEVERTRFGGRMRELSLKQVVVNGDKIELWPRSLNTAQWNKPIELGTSQDDDETVEVRARGLLLSSIRRF